MRTRNIILSLLQKEYLQKDTAWQFGYKNVGLTKN